MKIKIKTEAQKIKEAVAYKQWQDYMAAKEFQKLHTKNGVYHPPRLVVNPNGDVFIQCMQCKKRKSDSEFKSHSARYCLSCEEDRGVLKYSREKKGY